MDSSGPVRNLKIALPTGSDPASVRARIEAMELLLERSFRIPVVNIPVGLDAVIGLVPVLGDVVSAGMAFYMLWEARNLNLSRWRLWQMAGNIAIDTLIGMIPVIGDAADLLYRSNSRNLRIIKRHLDKHHPSTQLIEG